MSWVTVIWSMIASACLTLAAIYFLVWCQRRTVWTGLLFSLTSAAVAVYAVIELSMMRAETPAQFATALLWLHVPVWVIVLSFVGFVRLHLRAGLPWLAWTICGLRTLALLLNFLVGQNLNYREVTGLRHIPFLGESVSSGVGVSNPCVLVGQLSLLLLLVFVADAAITVWRRGDRRLALVTGGSFLFFALAAIVDSLLVFWKIVDWPLTASFSFLGIVVAMGYEMSRETLRAAKLSDDLRESEERMTLAAEATGIGVWMWNIPSNEVWGSERWLSLFGFAPDAAVTFEKVIQRIRPDDREIVQRGVRRALADRSDYQADYRVLLPDGTQRWIVIRGRMSQDSHGKPARMLGTAIDITERKRTEAALRDLSGRLINAHEEERARLARELHDDLTQRLARLAIDAGSVANRADGVSAAETMRSVRDGLVHLSEDIHALSYRLHPAVLEDLGLAEALKAECERFSRQESIPANVTLRELPTVIPPETALCLFRVTQEALRNVARHAKAPTVKVSMQALDGGLQLAVRDDGAGFAPALQRERPSLGLASMRERVHLLEGELDIESAPGQGTTILVWVPLKK